ncbi:30S ribosomal protein S12 methylthiotransferase RimO [Kineosporia sp. J2-2]|uniref:Ribosomal protein uS12 methylthiotransferase RimO n=1 Tax=Kineosporia corallincola TaxID=2835133 RepID=A0ABS5TSY3_9ACTN|nr:30S ribosomal protein S12 methylthiotransferase RimO [Kineosporia corallincola]
MVAPGSVTRSVALVTLGCARNEVDSEELAGRLAAAGWQLVDDAENADVAVVNTCGFVEQAKKDSIDVLMEAAELKDDGSARTKAVVAVGCMAERYGEQLADSLPEADAVLGFDSYADLSTHLDAILHGEKPKSHVPVDRRTLLPLTPAARSSAAGVAVPGHGASPDPVIIGDLPDGVAPVSGPRVMRARLDGRPWAPLKLASGCDRRCAFCAIPAFRGAFLSRRPAEVLTEARWLGERGVKELFLVSENSTSYGKDLGDLRLLETMLPDLAAVDGVDRVRVSYLQPAELRPGLIDAIVGTEGVAPYFDLSFQHSSNAVLRRMRRFGSTGDFLTLLQGIRERSPQAGIRSNVIVGFPGETEADVEELAGFLVEARLDVVGVFGYSDEDGTEAATLDGKLPDDEIAARLAHITGLVEELTAQRAEERVGEHVRVLVEGTDDDDPDTVVGRAAHQGPEVDGQILLPGVQASPGDWIEAVVTESLGVDLIASPLQRAGSAAPVAVHSAG